ncbi:hypothetical protein HDV05_000449 [Chytridiales sp. JEL 0842]|nr:hypothetical protein HDV05_000449 [Chytridiales sp. JEL 0842]
MTTTLGPSPESHLIQLYRSGIRADEANEVYLRALADVHEWSFEEIKEWFGRFEEGEDELDVCFNVIVEQEERASNVADSRKQRTESTRMFTAEEKEILVAQYNAGVRDRHQFDTELSALAKQLQCSVKRIKSWFSWYQYTCRVDKKLSQYKPRLFTTKQAEILKRHYENGVRSSAQFMDTINDLAMKFNLKTKQIQIWFEHYHQRYGTKLAQQSMNGSQASEKSRKVEPVVEQCESIPHVKSLAKPADDRAFEIERILDWGYTDEGLLLLKVRWAGFSTDWDTWQTEDSFDDPNFLRKYFKSIGGRPKFVTSAEAEVGGVNEGCQKLEKGREKVELTDSTKATKKLMITRKRSRSLSTTPSVPQTSKKPKIESSVGSKPPARVDFTAGEKSMLVAHYEAGVRNHIQYEKELQALSEKLQHPVKKIKKWFYNYHRRLPKGRSAIHTPRKFTPEQIEILERYYEKGVRDVDKYMFYFSQLSEKLNHSIGQIRVWFAEYHKLHGTKSSPSGTNVSRAPTRSKLFTEQELDLLIQHYNDGVRGRTAYGKVHAELASRLGKTAKQIENWFYGYHHVRKNKKGTAAQIKAGSAAEKEDDIESVSFEVERIVDWGYTEEGSLLLKVRWEGFSEDWDTWEPEKSFDDPNMVSDYLKSIGGRPQFVPAASKDSSESNVNKKGKGKDAEVKLKDPQKALEEPISVRKRSRSMSQTQSVSPPTTKKQNVGKARGEVECAISKDLIADQQAAPTTNINPDALVQSTHPTPPPMHSTTSTIPPPIVPPFRKLEPMECPPPPYTTELLFSDEMLQDPTWDPFIDRIVKIDYSIEGEPKNVVVLWKAETYHEVSFYSIIDMSAEDQGQLPGPNGSSNAAAAAAKAPNLNSLSDEENEGEYLDAVDLELQREEDEDDDAEEDDRYSPAPIAVDPGLESDALDAVEGISEEILLEPSWAEDEVSSDSDFNYPVKAVGDSKMGDIFDTVEQGAAEDRLGESSLQAYGREKTIPTTESVDMEMEDSAPQKPSSNLKRRVLRLFTAEERAILISHYNAGVRGAADFSEIHNKLAVKLNCTKKQVTKWFWNYQRILRDKGLLSPRSHSVDISRALNDSNGGAVLESTSLGPVHSPTQIAFSTTSGHPELKTSDPLAINSLEMPKENSSTTLKLADQHRTKTRRYRTFTAEQRIVLLRYYEAGVTSTMAYRNLHNELAEKFGCTVQQILNWFNNQRKINQKTGLQTPQQPVGGPTGLDLSNDGTLPISATFSNVGAKQMEHLRNVGLQPPSEPHSPRGLFEELSSASEEPIAIHFAYDNRTSAYDMDMDVDEPLNVSDTDMIIDWWSSDNGTLLLKVRWAGCGENDDVWQTEDAFEDPALVREYFNSIGGRPQVSKPTFEKAEKAIGGDEIA